MGDPLFNKTVWKGEVKVWRGIFEMRFLDSRIREKSKISDSLNDRT